MDDSTQALTTETFAAEREWTVDGIPVLTAKLFLPRPAERCGRTARRIDRFYQLQGKSYLRYCEGWLFPQAAAEFRQALAGSGVLPCHRAELTYCVTCSECGVWSVRTQMLETAGARRTLMQRGDTWNLFTGWPIPLADCFPRHFPIRRTLLKTAEEDIRRQESSGTAAYHEAWRQELRRTYNRENFYLAPDGLRFFWQMNAVAPSAEGVPTFSLPFSDGGCRWPVPAGRS
ncbi:MAG: RsiV family protein [Oscillibacter sp.]|jgi:hypothetical protein|nr:RsiV family protein [Oscillibacter sp.]